MMCHWGYYWEDARAIIDIIDAGGEEVRSIRNLYALALNLTMSQHVAISSAGATYSYTRARKEWLQLVPALFSVASKDTRMVLAYLSSDLLTGCVCVGVGVCERESVCLHVGERDREREREGESWRKGVCVIFCACVYLRSNLLVGYVCVVCVSCVVCVHI